MQKAMRQRAFVTDTQALVKYFMGYHIINHAIHSIFMGVENGSTTIYVPSPVIFEIGYLFEKGRIPVSINHLRETCEAFSNLVEQPLNMAIIECAFDIDDIPELHDRLIAGTARYLDVPVLTNDPLIIASRFVTCI